MPPQGPTPATGMPPQGPTPAKRLKNTVLKILC